MTMRHPNATTAAGLTVPSVVAVWLLGHFGVNVSAEVGVTIGGAAITVVQLIGRKGLRGLARIVWRGQE